MLSSQPLQTPARVNYRRLFHLRNLTIAGQALVVAGVHWGLQMPLPIVAMASAMGLLIAVNLATAWRLTRSWPITDAELFAQLLVDVGVLTALLFLSGGSANPFVSLYLLPLIIVATVMRRAYTWAMAAITVACYSALVFYSFPLSTQHGAHGEFALHILGMWFNFMLSAALITFFIVRMKATLRERDRALAALREDSLRNERIVALGALAAGAAHELGTPLTTIAVITEDVARDYAHLPDLADDMHCLRDQVALCKRSLARLLASSGHARAEPTTSLALDAFLNEMLGQWQLMRPAIPVDAQWAGSVPAPRIVPEQTLNQTLLNLLNNAADASPQGLELSGNWDDAELTIEIRDHGPGLTPEVASRAAEPFFTTKAPGHGFGLGLFLANATIERLGGTVRLFNRSGGGACTRVTLPLANLAVVNA